MGIMYQAQSTPASVPQEAVGLDGDVTEDQATDRPLPSLGGKKKRRKLDVPDLALAPDRKKPRMDDFSYAKTFGVQTFPFHQESLISCGW